MPWLQAHTRRSGAEDDMLITLEVVHEFYKRGFKFEPINIYKSEVTKFVPTEDGLITPFTALPGVGAAAAQDIVEERKKEKFMSGEDIIMRCPKVGKSVVDALDKVGALGEIPKTNQLSFF